MLLKIITWAVIAGLVGIAIVTGAANLANAREVTGECVAPLGKVAYDIASAYDKVEVVRINDPGMVDALIKAFPNEVGVTFATVPEAVTVFGPLDANGTMLVVLAFHNGNCVIEMGHAKAVDVFNVLDMVAPDTPDDLHI